MKTPAEANPKRVTKAEREIERVRVNNFTDCFSDKAKTNLLLNGNLRHNVRIFKINLLKLISSCEFTNEIGSLPKQIIIETKVTKELIRKAKRRLKSRAKGRLSDAVRGRTQKVDVLTISNCFINTPTTIPIKLPIMLKKAEKGKKAAAISNFL